MRNKWVLLIIACLVLSSASTASAAMTLKQVGLSPFYKPPLQSEADLRTLVKTRASELKAGFAKAGYPELYTAFMEQFPTVSIEKTTVQPGETMRWMLFKKRGKGPVAVARDVTWGGVAPLDVYGFSITKNGEKYEFVVPGKCGNVALKGVEMIPPAVKPSPPPPSPKSVEKPMTVVPKKGGFIADIGYARQIDPGNYLFARVGYEYPLADKVYVLGMIGGYGHVEGEDGDSAFIADAMLEYRWTRFSIGLGGGYWSGDGGKMDVIADLGCRLSLDENSLLGKTSLFLEARSPSDKIDSIRDDGQVGLGLRFRF
jgi:hypothetical protein